MVRNFIGSSLGAAAARAVLRRLRDLPALKRTNFRGHEVTLAGGPALAAGATLGAVAATLTPPANAASVRVAAAVAVAGLGSGAVGLYDDVVGGRPEHAAKGFTGHLRALREGRVTSGLAKIAGVGAAALMASALLPPRVDQGRRAERTGRALGASSLINGRRRARPVLDVLLGAGVIAGAANLGNLLDLRPGRAIKAGLIAGAPLSKSPVAAGTLGAASALLPADLGEEIMLGDSGANALGALLGTAFVARTGTAGRLAALAGIVALTAASEKVSFTRVIERTPGLRELDALGRRPTPAPRTSGGGGPGR